MPGLGLSGLSGGLSGGSVYGGLSRPGLSRTLSMHPGDQEEHDELLSLEDQEGQAANCPTPHEALSLNWPSDQAQDGEGEEEEAPTRPPTPTQHLLHNEDHDDRALLALPPPPTPLPSLPPIETAPLGGPLTRSFSNFLHDDSKFFRPLAVPAAAPVPLRRIQPTPLPMGNAASAAALSAGSRVKRARATPASSKSLATTSAPAPAPASAPAAAPPPPRKKRRGMRPGTYMCLFKGELYECPHGCDIVEKGLLYDLLRR
jgi:hypothetical protein